LSYSDHSNEKKSVASTVNDGRRSPLLVASLTVYVVGWSRCHCIVRNLSQSFSLVVDVDQEALEELAILMNYDLQNLMPSSTLRELSML
ncbi:hypothetical protein T4D_11337, partial [Trichinella pseudospiralis]